MAYDICYVASHGFAARMIFQTELIRKLTSEGCTVAVVVPDASDPSLRIQAERQEADLIQFRCSDSNYIKQHMQFRRYFLEDLNANPCIQEKHELRMRDTSRHSLKWLQPRLGLAVNKICRRVPVLRSQFQRFERKIVFSSSPARQFLKKLSPKLLIATYPIMPPEPQLILAASALRIRTVLHLLSWDNITAKGQFPALCDEYIAWGPIMQDELLKHYGIPSRKVYACGVPHFDQHFLACKNPSPGEALSKVGLDPDKPYLFFAMSSPRFAPKEIDIVERLSMMVRTNEFGPDVQLLVRPHPQNVTGFMAEHSWLSRLVALAGQRVGVDMPSLVDSQVPWSMEKEDMVRLSHLIAGASLVLNSGSTISIDALAVNRPVLLTSFDADTNLPYWKSARRLLDYVHLKKFVNLGGVDVVRSFAEMADGIRRSLNCQSEGREMRLRAFQQECGCNDGRATDRVAETLLSILNAQCR